MEGWRKDLGEEGPVGGVEEGGGDQALVGRGGAGLGGTSAQQVTVGGAATWERQEGGKSPWRGVLEQEVGRTWGPLWHTVPQEGQKRPALNSTNDCARKI